MKTITPLFLLFFSTFFILFSPAAIAQDKVISQLQAEFVSSWLVTVDNEDRSRTLRISGLKEDSPSFSLDAIYNLDAIYGWTDGNQTPIKAELIVTAGEKHTIHITTQPGSKIDAVQGLDGIFVGTFTAANGGAKGVTIKKLSENALAETKAQIAEGPVVDRPTANVPTSCAKFIGGWTGDWGFGKRQLWITAIDASCSAKYSYSPQTKTFKYVGIKDGNLSFQCGSSGGTCFFEHHGDELWGRYAGSDGDNTAVFRKIKNGLE
ncbi:MAG: hypothetical protein Q8O19_07265 [Rectinemataceae bacterium]|nr:hypothetical protein [Rectinemataceae bacterium]